MSTPITVVQFGRSAGPTCYRDPCGTLFVNEFEVVNKSGNIFTTAFQKPVNGEADAIQKCINKLAFLDWSSKACNLGIPLSTDPTKITESVKPDLETLFDITTGNEDFYNDARLQALDELSIAQDKTKTYTDINTCIEETLAKMRSTSGSSVGNLLSSLVNLGINAGLAQINQSLPSEARLSVNYDASSNTLNSLSIGGVTYDPNSTTLSYNGNLFDSIIEDGLSSVNQQLPSYLQLTSNDLGLNLNNVSVSYKSLVRTVSGVEFDPNTGQPLGPGTVYSTTEGQIKFNVANQTFDIGRLANDAVTGVTGRVVNAGVNVLNASLPDQIQVQSSLNYNAATGKTTGTLAVGPVVYDPSTGGLSLSADSISSSLNSLVEPLFSSLPGPLAPAAALLWRAISPVNILKGLLSPGLFGAEDAESTYTKARKLCEGKLAPAAPGVAYFPASTNATDFSKIGFSEDSGSITPPLVLE